MKSVKEIGSEFWLNPRNLNRNDSFEKLISFGADQKLLYTGRTAIDFVLEDLRIPVSSVYMPSYCCESMLQPFIDRKIKIEFYEVLVNNSGFFYNIDFDKDVNIFFATSYFGYNVTNMDSIIDRFKTRKNLIVIEDITHRLLGGENFCPKADYYVASLRKWFEIPTGGLAIKREEKFSDIKLSSPPEEAIESKIQAMKIKARYLNNNQLSIKIGEIKSEYLKLFSKFNKKVSMEYKLFAIDRKSKELLQYIDIEQIKSVRKNNAMYIYNNLELPKGARFLFPNPDFEKDCYLFIPLLLNNKKQRDKLRTHLISNSIYCPIHWPVPNKIKNKNTDDVLQVFNRELSLICDQRYEISDIYKMLKKVGEFIN